MNYSKQKSKGNEKAERAQRNLEFMKNLSFQVSPQFKSRRWRHRNDSLGLKRLFACQQALNLNRCTNPNSLWTKRWLSAQSARGLDTWCDSFLTFTNVTLNAKVWKGTPTALKYSLVVFHERQEDPLTTQWKIMSEDGISPLTFFPSKTMRGGEWGISSGQILTLIKIKICVSPPVGIARFSASRPSSHTSLT